MDEFDRKILNLIQSDATLSVADIADNVGLSSTPCWRRIRNLEQAGVIERRVAILDPAKIGLGATVFVGVKAGKHASGWLDDFAAVVQDIEEIVEVYRLSGEIDYLMKVMVPDIASYDAVYKRLIRKVDFDDVSSFFAMEEIKMTTELPLGYVART